MALQILLDPVFSRAEINYAPVKDCLPHLCKRDKKICRKRIPMLLIFQALRIKVLRYNVEVQVSHRRHGVKPDLELHRRQSRARDQFAPDTQHLNKQLTSVSVTLPVMQRNATRRSATRRNAPSYTVVNIDLKVRVHSFKSESTQSPPRCEEITKNIYIYIHTYIYREEKEG